MKYLNIVISYVLVLMLAKHIVTNNMEWLIWGLIKWVILPCIVGYYITVDLENKQK